MNNDTSFLLNIYYVPGTTHFFKNALTEDAQGYCVWHNIISLVLLLAPVLFKEIKALRNLTTCLQLCSSK